LKIAENMVADLTVHSLEYQEKTTDKFTTFSVSFLPLFTSRVELKVGSQSLY